MSFAVLFALLYPTQHSNYFAVVSKGNALLPPQHDGLGMSSTQDIEAIHSRLDPNNQSVEEAWKRRDIWGLLLVPYALLLRSAALPHLTSPRGSSSGERSPSRSPRAKRIGNLDVKDTFSKCLEAASQLKSLTFARMSLIPSFGMPSVSVHNSSSRDNHGDDSSSFDFFVSIFAEFTSQYIDALCSTGNLPITREGWYAEESNSAQNEWFEKDQKRQFGMWAGQAVEEDTSGPREVNVMDRPDCLEDVFALVSSICSTHPAGAKAFWIITEEKQMIEDGSHSLVLRLAPSRFLRRLDLIHAENTTSLFVYISFLASLALADGTDEDESSNGASMVNAFLSGQRSITSTQSDRHPFFGWGNVMKAIRWYADELSLEAGDEVNQTSPSDQLRRSTSMQAEMNESSESYYYGVGDASTNADSGRETSSPPEQRRQGQTSSSARDSTTKELDEVGRNTLMSLLSLISNVAARSSSAREYILALQVPVEDGGPSGRYQDDSLEILFALLTTSISPDIQGMTFMAIANLLQTIPSVVQPPPSSDANSSQAGRRAWELLEYCQFIPIKLLSQFSFFAAGVGTMPPASTFGRKNQSANELPASVFPKSNDYGMIYQLEHMEAKDGTYPATEGFMYLLTTLIKVAGCPSDLGSQWRIRPGCAPYIEFVTEFVLPRATGTVKNVKSLPFATVADECRLVNRALEVVEAVLVRYVVPPVSGNISFNEVKDRHQSFINLAKKELGVSLVLSDILVDAADLNEEAINDAIQDFRNNLLQVADPSVSNRRQMLEASFGKQVPLPKTPGFSVLANLLSSNNGHIFQIIQKLLSQNGGSRGVHEYGEIIMFKALGTALFRETPPVFTLATDGAIYLEQKQRNQMNELTFQASITSLLQSMIQPIHPTSLLSCSENASRGEAANDAILWRERTLLLSLRILCAAAVREEAFIQSLREASVPISVVPTLSFKGPIHGSFAHRFVEEQKVNVSKLSSLLTKASTSVYGQIRAPELLPIIADYVGYGACSLTDIEGIAKNAFFIISYISNILPQNECVHSMCGEDVSGVRLANAFSKGVSLPGNDLSIRDAILGLILTNIDIDSGASNEMNLSLIMLGMNGSKHNCLNVILKLIADTDFVVNPKTSSSATKCFELMYRVFEVGAHNIPPNVRTRFWHSQVVRYLGERGPSTPSVLKEISDSFIFEYGDNLEISRRNNDVLHSISWLLKGLSIELRALVGGEFGLATSALKSIQFKSLLDLLFSQPLSLLQTALGDLPLGQSSNDFIQQNLHAGSPSRTVLMDSTIPMQGPIDVCVGYDIIDTEQLLSFFRDDPTTTKDAARGWAIAWNAFVGRVCACSHIAQAWSDVTRTALVLSPLVETDLSMNAKVAVEILCTLLLRLVSDGNLNLLGQYVALPGVQEDVIGGFVEAESAVHLSVAVLSLTEYLFESSQFADNDGDAQSDFSIAEEDVARICALLAGAIASCAQRGADLSSNDGRAAVLSCAWTQMLSFSEATNCVISQNCSSNILEVYANATSHLFGLATSAVFSSHERYANVHESKQGAIALAARSGILSFFGHLSVFENESAVEVFSSKIFTLESVSTRVERLVHLITFDDSDVANILQQIALMHKDGVQLLAKSRVTAALLAFSKSYAAEEKKYLDSHMGLSGGAQLNPPTTLNGHLSLLNVLLSSPLANSDRVALAVDSFQLLKEYSRTVERLLSSYPSNETLTVKFIETMDLTYSALKKSSSAHMLENSPLNTDSAALGLEQAVLCLTYQLSSFPFPRQLLPQLPMGLLNVEKIHSSQLKNISVSLADDSKTWWNRVAASALGGQPLPCPPTGSSDAGVYQRYNLNQYAAGSGWTEGHFHRAISAAKCLEVSLMFLLSRVHFVAQRNSFSFSIDSVAIAKGICRCSDASRVSLFDKNALI